VAAGDVPQGQTCGSPATAPAAVSGAVDGIGIWLDEEMRTPWVERLGALLG
jgi:hypothetical protein